MKNIEMRQSGQVSVCRCLVLNYSDLSVLAPTRFKRFLDQKKKSSKDMSGFSHPNSLFNARNPYLLTLSAIFKLYFFLKKKKIKHKWPKRVGFHLREENIFF